MRIDNPLSPAARATLAGLLTGAVGLVILRLAGAEMPAVPPGLILLTLAAVLVGLTRRRWSLALGALAGLAEVAGFLASGSAADLADPSPLGIFVGTWIRGLGIITAVIAGTVAAACRAHKIPSIPR
jgi:hypothetical protein